MKRPVAALAAYVLHRYDWSESSLIVDLFTRELGRVAVAARGAKRPYSQLRPVLLPFQRLNVSLGRLARGDEAAEVQNLRGAEWAGGAPMLAGEALFSGFYCNELLMKLIARNDPHPTLFDAYADTLAAIGAPAGSVGTDDRSAQAALRAFELSVLRDIGLLPDLRRVTLTLAPLDTGLRYALRPESGVVVSRADEPLLAEADLRGIQAALDTRSTAALQAACAGCAGALRVQLRALLLYHLGQPQLRTRQVMLDVQRLAEGARSAAPSPARPSSRSHARPPR